MTREDAIAALESLPETPRISVARLQPSDVIVVETDHILSEQEIVNLKQCLSEIWPANKVAVFEGGLSMKVANGQ